MYHKALLVPLLVQVFLTFSVWVIMFVTRVAEMKSKKIEPQAVHGRTQIAELLVDSAPAANNLKNLFELPVLFYLAILLASLLMIKDPFMVAMAWGFVGFRVVHSLIHCSYNRVIHRFYAYLISSVFLLLMWLRLAAYIFAH